ncbi:MAG: pyrroline-5-carboxylate reductase [Promethearchaeota archaeon]
MFELGILGCGFMGGAILEGIVNKKILNPNKILIFDVVKQKSQMFEKKLGIHTALNEIELIEDSDYILIAIKPQYLGNLLEKIKKNISKEKLENKCFMSIVAGQPISVFKEKLGNNVPIIRIMPNLLVSVNKSAATITYCKNTNKTQIEFCKNIFNALGITVEVKEELMDVITGLSGSGPAFIALFIEALADGAVKMGLPRDIAYKLAAQTVAGTGTLLIEKELIPAELKDRVASPGGTTIQGILALEKGNFRYTVMNAVIEATKRSQELGKKK